MLSTDCEESTLLTTTTTTTTRKQKILEIDRKLINKFKQRNQHSKYTEKVVYTRERLTKIKRAVLVREFEKNSQYWPTELKEELAI
jgi:hypothetical protein